MRGGYNKRMYFERINKIREGKSIQFTEHRVHVSVHKSITGFYEAGRKKSYMARRYGEAV
jgi:hypothetical protein